MTSCNLNSDETPTTDLPTTLHSLGPDSALAVAGEVIEVHFQVTGDGGVVPNYDIHFEVTGGRGHVPSVLPTDRDGAATLSWQLGATPGRNSLVVTAPGLQDSPSTVVAWGTHSVPLGDTTRVVDFAFDPDNLLIDVGGSVTFVGVGPSSYQLLVADLGSCNREDLKPGQVCTWGGLPFWPGSYQVRVGNHPDHPDMIATIVVRQ
jgi:hypothetical protein